MDQDVIAVELKAVFVTANHLLNTLEAVGVSVVHIRKENFHWPCPTPGGWALSKLVSHQLAALRHPNTIIRSQSQQMTTHLAHMIFFKHHPIVSTAQ